MKKFRNNYNNKGFSLIELIVTVLITAVLMIGVIAFISTSRSAYQTVNVSSTLQEETITVKRILSEYITEAKRYGFQKNVNDIDGSSGDVTVLWVVARDTESDTNPDCSYFFALDTADKKLRYCTGAASLCPENQTVLTDDAKEQISNECFDDDVKKKYSVIGEHVESMEKGGVAQRYDGTDLIAIKLVYRYPDGSGPKYIDEITVVTRNRLRATPTPTPKPTPTPLPTSDPTIVVPPAVDPPVEDPPVEDPPAEDPPVEDPPVIPTNAPNSSSLLVTNDNNGGHSKFTFNVEISRAVIQTDSSYLDVNTGGNNNRYKTNSLGSNQFEIIWQADGWNVPKLSEISFNVANDATYARVISFN